MLDLLCTVLFTLLQTSDHFTLATDLLLHLELRGRDDAVQNLRVLLYWIRFRGYVVVLRARLVVDLIWVKDHLMDVRVHNL